MRGPAIRTLAAGVLSAIVLAQPAAAAWREKFEVYGVAEGDMLKMRGGPGTGFDVWVGLPNGTVVPYRLTLAWVKVDGKWLVAQHHGSPVPK